MEDFRDIKITRTNIRLVKHVKVMQFILNCGIQLYIEEMVMVTGISVD